MRRRQQVHGGSVRDHVHLRVRFHAFEEGSLDGEPRAILKVNDARNGMAGLARQIEFSRMLGRRIERHMQFVDQNFFYQARPFVAEQRGRRRRAEPGPSGKNIRDKLLGRFLVRDK